MEYCEFINGLEVLATYSDESVEKIFVPFLKKLAEIHDKKGNRAIAMIAAPPGAGKSTMASFLEFLAKDVIPGKTVKALGMDGFHKRQEYLQSHAVYIDGERVPLVEIKGAPITFDLKKLKYSIEKVARGEICGWPVYDRVSHNPIEDRIKVDADIVILEGNYLLLDIEGWRDLSSYADYTMTIIADGEQLHDRLIARKRASSGFSMEKVKKFVEFSDMSNVWLCLSRTKPADMQLVLDSDNQYSLIRREGE
ncbi:nucleoside/nucleotide kinase family protein [Butyrivibrio sp. X503]|uniref:nucleoside/nucleotide kinase family protein n=1 Tax=Butyrivibrio sp. X503 TaxID=2364878 RepID=UPI000EA9E8BC|nr:nucleoside/nucleotide kinase family protein [Butyrivibrio sp. X503]RKM53967.1 nucleoside/nucleotide kinase family protein [Butyrivibrio sp. X503]